MTDINSETLRQMAPAFLSLGQGLSIEYQSPAAMELGGQLRETAEYFTSLPQGGIDLGHFSASHRIQFIENLTELAKVARAAGNPLKREDELLEIVGSAADRLGISSECSDIATALVRILVDLPGDANPSA